MMTHERNTRFGTRAIHAGQRPEPTTGAIMTPVFQTSTYVQPELGRHTGYEYARTQNPTREALEGNVASLEGGKYGVAFAISSPTWATYSSQLFMISSRNSVRMVPAASAASLRFG